MLIEAARLLLFPALMAFAACSDLLTMTISNRVTAGLVVGFAAMALVTGMPLASVLDHGEAGLVVLVGAFVLFSRGWIGGGDAKLAAATALWIGWTHLLEYLVYASLLGGVLTVLLLQFRKVVLPSPLVRCDWIERLHHPDSGVPYGIALAASALLIYPYTTWMEMLGR
jgi:prepilin peptidase CpaA